MHYNLCMEKENIFVINNDKFMENYLYTAKYQLTDFTVKANNKYIQTLWGITWKAGKLHSGIMDTFKTANNLWQSFLQWQTFSH